MKALSIRQPWAWLIVNGYKDIENRTWSTKFRGEFLIHASKTFDENGYQRLWTERLEGADHIPEMPHPDDPHRLARGYIVGCAKIVDCVTASDSSWFEGPYGFVIEEAKVLPPQPYKGRLGFFEIVRRSPFGHGAGVIYL